MKRTTEFRGLIHGAEILQLPCCHDGLSARILEQAGFKAIAAAGYGLAGSLLGMPDIGVLTGSEMITQNRKECFEFIGAREIRERERQWVSGGVARG